MTRVARYQLDDGRIARFEVPEGTTPEQAQAIGQDYFASQQQRPQLEAEPSPIRDTAMGMLELGTAVGTGAAAEVAAGVGGIAQSINPFAAPGAGAQAVDSIRGAMTYQPGERGQHVASSFADRIRAISGAIPQFARDSISGAFQSVQQSPDAVAERYGPLAGAAAKALPAAIGSVAGLPVARQAGAAGARAIEPVADVLSDVASVQGPAKRAIGRKIAAGSTDVDTARFRLAGPQGGGGGAGGIPPAPPGAAAGAEQPRNFLARVLDSGGPKVTADRVARGAIKQGFEEGVVAAVKGASPGSKKQMQKMVDIMERVKKNRLYGMSNRPSDVAGDALMERVRTIQNVNRDAGRQLDDVAKALQGQRVNFNPAVNNFMDDLADMGVTLDSNLKPVFAGSDVEGVLGAQKVINNIVHRMRNTKAPDAYDVHRLKRYIDEQVTYGKNAEGLAGKTERILKKLRHNMDQTLDSSFPEYNRVNTTYAETIGALDALQDVAGKKMNLLGPNADKATGTLMRRIMSNAQSRVPLMDAIDGIESIAQKYAGSPGFAFSDDLRDLVLFTDELDRVFGPVARTSFQGQIDQSVQRGVRAVSSEAGFYQAATEMAGKVADKARGVNDDAAFRSIRELLSGG